MKRLRRTIALGFTAIAAVGLLLVPGSPAIEAAEPRPPLEYQVKASMIYNFLQFAAWPIDALPEGHPIRVCVAGQNRFGPALTALQNEIAQGRRVEVVSAVTEPSQFEVCQLLFVSGQSEESVARVLDQVRGKSVLTVGESKHFLDFGGAINFIVNDGKLRFEVSEPALLDARLELSSKVLRLAQQVRPRT